MAGVCVVNGWLIMSSSSVKVCSFTLPEHVLLSICLDLKATPFNLAPSPVDTPSVIRPGRSRTIVLYGCLKFVRKRAELGGVGTLVLCKRRWQGEVPWIG